MVPLGPRVASLAFRFRGLYPFFILFSICFLWTLELWGYHILYNASLKPRLFSCLFALLLGTWEECFRRAGTTSILFFWSENSSKVGKWSKDVFDPFLNFYRNIELDIEVEVESNWSASRSNHFDIEVELWEPCQKAHWQRPPLGWGRPHLPHRWMLPVALVWMLGCVLCFCLWHDLQFYGRFSAFFRSERAFLTYFSFVIGATFGYPFYVFIFPSCRSPLRHGHWKSYCYFCAVLWCCIIPFTAS